MGSQMGVKGLKALDSSTTSAFVLQLISKYGFWLQLIPSLSLQFLCTRGRNVYVRAPARQNIPEGPWPYYFNQFARKPANVW